MKRVREEVRSNGGKQAAGRAAAEQQQDQGADRDRAQHDWCTSHFIFSVWVSAAAVPSRPMAVIDGRRRSPRSPLSKFKA